MTRTIFYCQPKLALCIGVAVLAVSLYLNLHTHRPSIQTLTHGHSAGFRGPGIPDPLTPPSPTDALLINTPEFHLQADIHPSAQNIHVSFLYKCTSRCGQIWLGMDTQKFGRLETLIAHPVFDQINWFHLNTSGFKLYQKHLNYSSLQDLLSHTNQPLLAEKVATLSIDLANHPIIYLEEVDYIGTVSAVLTSYEPQGVLQDWHRTSRTLSLNYATPSANQVDLIIRKTGDDILITQPLLTVN